MAAAAGASEAEPFGVDLRADVFGPLLPFGVAEPRLLSSFFRSDPEPFGVELPAFAAASFGVAGVGGISNDASDYFSTRQGKLRRFEPATGARTQVAIVSVWARVCTPREEK